MAELELAESTGSDPSIEELVDRFEEAGHGNGKGDKTWFARDLAVLLGYTKWENFVTVLSKAKDACSQAGHDPADHFPGVRKMITIGKGGRRAIEDMELSRYAAYLTAQNADPKKRPVAIAQTYFAVQTRRQEISDREGPDFSTLPETKQRLYLRNQVVQQNKKLATTAQGAGVQGRDFGKFNNRGYQGLYGERGAAEIREYKGLKPNSPILDFMGSTELAANLFRITQTEERLRHQKIRHASVACEAHYEVGRKVRETMRQLSGVLPEDLPTAEDVKKLASSERRIQRSVPADVIVSKGQDREEVQETHKQPVAIDLKSDLWKYALLIMAVRPNGTITTKDLIAELPNYIQVSEAQAEANASRKDSRFSQIVRNLKSHKSFSTNFIFRGFAEDVTGGFKITDKGLAFVQTYFSDQRPPSLDERSDHDELEWVAHAVGLSTGELAELEWDLQPIDSDGATLGWMVTFAANSDRKLLSKVHGLGLGYTVQVGFPPDEDVLDADDDLLPP